MVVSALGYIAHEESVGLLAKLLRDPDGNVRVWAIDSLCQIGQDEPETLGQRCLEHMERLFDDPLEGVRSHAVAWSTELREDLDLPPNPRISEIERELECREH